VGKQAVDVAQLVRQAAALRALAEVGVHRAAVAPGEPASDVGAETGPVGRARLGARRQDVRLQVTLAQPLPGAVGQHGHGVGRHPDGASHVPGSLSLDRGVPEHGLPAIGQPGERLDDESTIAEGEDLVRLGGHHGLGHLVEDAVVGNAAVCGQPADGHEQVRPERVGGPAPAAERADHPLERLVDDVLGVGPRAVAAGQAQGGGTVAHVELGERGVLAVPHLPQQRGVGQCGVRHRRRELPIPRAQCAAAPRPVSCLRELTARSTAVTTTF
jgi:hypothetical protein